MHTDCSSNFIYASSSLVLENIMDQPKAKKGAETVTAEGLGKHLEMDPKCHYNFSGIRPVKRQRIWKVQSNITSDQTHRGKDDPIFSAGNGRMHERPFP